MVEKMAGRHLSPLEMRAPSRIWARLAVSLPLLLAAAAPTSRVLADPRTEFFIKQLKTSDDFKVRTQAALALGASGDAAAVDPLCGGLKDSNSSVKVAAAAALGKLGKSEGAACLKAAKSRESDADVLKAIERSLGSLAGGGDDTPAVIGASTKYYVAIQVTNKTSRASAEIDKVVRSAASAKLLSGSAYAIAPKSESPTQGGQVCKDKKLKGLLLITSVEAPVYSGGKVSISFNSTIWTYPDKSLKATITGTRSTEAQGSSDIEGENLLIQAASEDAAKQLMAKAASL